MLYFILGTQIIIQMAYIEKVVIARSTVKKKNRKCQLLIKLLAVRKVIGDLFYFTSLLSQPERVVKRRFKMQVQFTVYARPRVHTP